MINASIEEFSFSFNSGIVFGSVKWEKYAIKIDKLGGLPTTKEKCGWDNPDMI